MKQRWVISIISSIWSISSPALIRAVSSDSSRCGRHISHQHMIHAIMMWTLWWILLCSEVWRSVLCVCVCEWKWAIGEEINTSLWTVVLGEIKKKRVRVAHRLLHFYSLDIQQNKHTHKMKVKDCDRGEWVQPLNSNTIVSSTHLSIYLSLLPCSPTFMPFSLLNTQCMHIHIIYT